MAEYYNSDQYFMDDNRSSYLNPEQVARLNRVMNETVKILGNGSFPTLQVRFSDLVNMVRNHLFAQYVPDQDDTPFQNQQQPFAPSGSDDHFHIQSTRLNGGAVTHVLTEDTHPINDLDLMFNVRIPRNRDFERIKGAVLRTLVDLMPPYTNRERLTPRIIKEGYVSKMVKVYEGDDRWSLISLGTVPGRRIVELKFVDRIRRPFEFSVDSFQIVLDSLLLYQRGHEQLPYHFYPPVLCESMYGDFNEAMGHLRYKLIVTRNPEQIRGGGLLKYCNLISRNYRPFNNGRVEHNNNFEQYMCSRFFLDIPNTSRLHNKLINYLKYHFCAPGEEHMKIKFLCVLIEIVDCSTVPEKEDMIKIINELLQQIAKPGQNRR